MRLITLYIITGQIEQYKQKTQTILQSSDKTTFPNRKFKFVKSKVQSDPKDLVSNSALNSKMLPESLTKNVHVKSELLATNVYVNPNFKPQKSTVHINPNIHAKPLIHINPKMMHNISNSNQNLQNNTSTINTSTTQTNVGNSTGQTNVKRSIYVNPTLLKKLSFSKEKSTNSRESVTTERSVCSRLKFVKNIDNRKILPKKTSNSSIVLLSRRKLVRVSTTKSTSKTIPSKSAGLKDKKLETMSQKVMKMKSSVNNTLQSRNMIFNLSKSNVNKISNNKSKVTKYKIDRTALHISKIKGTSLSEVKKIM